MVDDSLDDAKRRVRSEFLGREGVHAVALRRSTGEVVVFVDGADDLTALRARVEAVAAPHRVAIVREPRPTAG